MLENIKKNDFIIFELTKEFKELKAIEDAKRKEIFGNIITSLDHENTPCKVKSISEGLLIFRDYNRNGKANYDYYTKDYLIKNNMLDSYNFNKNIPVYEIELIVEGGLIVLDTKNIKSIQKDWRNSKINTAIQKAIDYCNNNSEDDDIIYKAINKYKVLRDLTEEQQDIIYNNIVNAMGYSNKY